MKLLPSAPLPRRRVLAGSLAALALLGAVEPRPAEARIILTRGMTGGGLVKLEGGGEPALAHFSLFASSMQFPEGDRLVLGTIQWIEAGSGLQLVTTEVTQCIPMEDQADGADIRGRMSVNGEGNYPFVLHAIDSGAPGSGLDAIELEINGPNAREGTEAESNGSDFIYQVSGTLVAGDFQWIIVDAEIPG